MAIATGLFKKLFIKRQTGLNSKAAAGAAGTSRSMRRVTSTLDLVKNAYQSNEVLDSQQRRDSRHGTRGVNGTLSGELSLGTYQQQFESVLRAGISAPVITTGSLTNVTATISAAGRKLTLARAAGNYITDGFNIGDVVSVSGFLTTAIPNNRTCIITAMPTNGGQMTLQAIDNTSLFTAKVSGDPITVALIGKKIIIPQTGHTRDYYTVEHWFGDIASSELFTDVVFTGFTANLPPSGLATVEFPMMGLDMSTDVAQYFTSPAAPSIGATMASVNGTLVINGNPVGVITGFSIVVNGNYSYPTGDGVVGSNLRPDILPGPIDVTGQMTVLFDSPLYRDLFLNETESTVIVALTADSGITPQFVSFVMSRVKFNGSSKDDTNAGLTMTLPYVALENVRTGGAALPNLATTLTIQDSTFV